MTHLGVVANLVLGLVGVFEPTVSTWEDRILAERQVIQSGFLRAKAELVYVAQNNRKIMHQDLVKFDIGRVLLDRTTTRDGKTERTVTCRDGEDANMYFSHALVDGKTQQVDYLSVFDYAKFQGPLSQPDKTLKSGVILDPKAVGLVPIDFASTVLRGWDVVFRRGDVVEATVADGRFEGSACKVLRYTLKNDSSIIVFFRADGPLIDVVCVEWSYIYHGIKGLERIVNKNKVHATPTGPVMYPERCAFTQTQDGHPTLTEDLQIDVVSLNTPIDASAFTISGMNVPIGAQVVEEPVKHPGYLMWDGANVVPKLSSPLPTRSSGFSRP